MKSFYPLLCSLLLTGCSQQVAETPEEQTTELLQSPAYTIIATDPNPALSKIAIEVLLPEKLSEGELRQVALRIKSEHGGYAKTWIAYYLPGMKPGAGAWATTHFIPDLEVTVLGASKEQETAGKQQAEAVKGDIIGRWYEEQYTHSSFVIYRWKGGYRLKTIFANGQTSEEQLVRKGMVFTYQPRDGYNGEYFKLLPGGGLGLFNREGKMLTEARVVE